MVLMMHLQFPVEGDRLMELVDVVSSAFSFLVGWTAHGRHYGQLFSFKNKILAVAHCCYIV